MRRLASKLTYANVVSTICLFLLLGGGAAFATSQLGNNSIGPKQLKKNAVTTAKIKNAAVTTGKLKGDAVTGAKVKDGSLTGADIDQSTLTGARASNVTAISITDDATCSPARPLPAGITTERSQEGVCKVTVPASLEDCARIATVNFHPPHLFGVGPRTAYVATPSATATVLTIHTFNREAGENLPFDLVLVC